MLLKKVVAVTAIFVAAVFGENVDVASERSILQVNFGSTYETYIHNDIELCVSLPKGYTVAAVMPGSPDFVSVVVLQNRLYISKVTPDVNMMTNLTVHVITDEGLEKELYFKLHSSKNAPKVLAIQFEKPNYSELNATVEALKSKYNNQMNNTLSEQEQAVTKSVKKSTMINARPWFIKAKHGGKKVEFKGATVRLMGLVNFDGGTYVYLEGPQQDGQCEIFSLQSVEVNGQQRVVELVGVDESVNLDNSVAVYEIPEVPFKITDNGRFKNVKFILNVKIWSAINTVKFKAQ